MAQTSPEARAGKVADDSASLGSSNKELARHTLQTHATELRLAGSTADKTSPEKTNAASVDVADAGKKSDTKPHKVASDKPGDKPAEKPTDKHKAAPATVEVKLDSQKSVEDMVKAGMIKDVSKPAAALAEADKLAPGQAPGIKIQMTDAALAPKDRPKADFVVNKDGSITMNNNPEKTGQKNINIEVQRGVGQLMPTEAQQKSVEELYKYLDGRVKGNFPDATKDGVKIDDPQNLIPEKTEKALKAKNPADTNTTDLPDSVRRQVEDMERFRGTKGGTLPREQVDSYFPNRDVPRQDNENDRIAAMKDVVSGFTSRGDSKPYEHIVHRGEQRGWGVGRYGLTYDNISNWLQNLDMADLQKQEEAGKVPAGTVERMRRMKESVARYSATGQSSDLDPFLAKLKAGDKENPITAEEINANFGKEVQELTSTHQLARFNKEIGQARGGKVDPGELALAMMVGHVPTAEEMANPDYARFMQAARQAYNLSVNRQQPGDNVLYTDTGTLTEAMKNAIGKQLWRGFDGPTQNGNLGCAITVTRILRAGGVPVSEQLSVEGTKNEMRRIGAQAVSLEQAIASGKHYVIIKQSGGSHTGIGIGRTVVENSSGSRDCVTRDISRSSLRSGSYAYILPTKNA